MRVQVDESISAVWGGRPGGVVAEAGAQSESHCPAFGRGVGGVEAKVSAVRPAKLAAILQERHGKHVLAVSTAGEILARHGLVRKRRLPRSAGPIEHGP